MSPVAKLYDPGRPPQVGDVLVWNLPASSPQPCPGATMAAEGHDPTNGGDLRRIWWAHVTQAGPVPYPRPVWHVRPERTADDGSVAEDQR